TANAQQGNAVARFDSLLDSIRIAQERLAAAIQELPLDQWVVTHLLVDCWIDAQENQQFGVACDQSSGGRQWCCDLDPRQCSNLCQRFSADAFRVAVNFEGGVTGEIGERQSVRLQDRSAEGRRKNER